MSNFEDYDLTRGGGNRGRANGAPNRTNNGPSRRPVSQSGQGSMNYDFSLDGEVDMYDEYAEYGQQPGARPARRPAPQSGSHPGARRASSSGRSGSTT